MNKRYMKTKNKKQNDHRFLDEAWDTTFYWKWTKNNFFWKIRPNIVWTNGVSKAFYMWSVKIKTDLNELRNKISELEKQIENNDNFKNIPSVKKRIQKFWKFFFHSKEDIFEIKEIFFNFLKEVDFSCEVIISRKKINIFENKHNWKDELFYADILSHLLKNKFNNNDKIVFNIAKRWNSTKQKNIDLAKEKAIERAISNSKWKNIYQNKEIVFNVQLSNKDPLLSIPDYMLWAIQRLCEKWEIKYYDFIKEKYPVIIDIYDTDNFKNYWNYYNNKPWKFLTEKNFIK